ncbi:hypothetical protein HS125_19310 [bacterium]|nr:hypothetical protein [bacterium]
MRGGWRRTLRRLWSRLFGLAKGDVILCDHCRLNYGNACARPERPNAVSCEDFIAK